MCMRVGVGMKRGGRKWREKPFWPLIISREAFLTLKTMLLFQGEVERMFTILFAH